MNANKIDIIFDYYKFNNKMDHKMEYNYLKSLPKDILIKIIYEVEENFTKTRREWFCDIIEEAHLGHCSDKDCYKILNQFTKHLFFHCDACNITTCAECAEKSGISYYSCEKCKNLEICSKCKICNCCIKNEY